MFDNTEIRYYGEEPKIVGKFETDFKEMVHFQYLPVKMADSNRAKPILEKRLLPFAELIQMAINDFVRTYGASKYKKSYIYLTVKRKYIEIGSVMNRQGWHSDGFMTDDINYIWYDSSPTIFNLSRFDLTQDDKISMQEMSEQAKIENNTNYSINTLLRLDQYNIHKVFTRVNSGMRTFVKISFSKDKYDLEGNAHNYEIDYDWEMRPRQKERNIPQKL